jgi:hypothetical protein
MALSLLLMVVAAMLYHWVFLKGAREGWPIVGTLVSPSSSCPPTPPVSTSVRS